MTKWASLGTGGEWDSNCHRDLLRWAQHRGVILEKIDADITCQSLETHEHETRKHRLLYPHEVFAAIYAGGDAAFKHMLLGEGGEEGLKQFWEREWDKDWGQHHPGFREHGRDPAKCIPIGVHADKGQHISRDKVLNIAWGSTTSRATTAYSKFLFTVVPDDLLIKGTTDEQLYAILVWSLNVMTIGKHPDTDHNGKPWPRLSRRELLAGQPLAGGYVALFSEYRGDWEWSCETFMWRSVHARAGAGRMGGEGG
eukprot:8749664-Pyramimonas_sp.AAC.1